MSFNPTQLNQYLFDNEEGMNAIASAAVEYNQIKSGLLEGLAKGDVEKIDPFIDALGSYISKYIKEPATRAYAQHFKGLLNELRGYMKEKMNTLKVEIGSAIYATELHLGQLKGKYSDIGELAAKYA